MKEEKNGFERNLDLLHVCKVCIVGVNFDVDIF